MQFPFTKMHALGNDYIIINGFEYPNLLDIAPQLALPMSDRHFGIGGDGIIFALPSEQADCMMRIFNADGSEAQMCGNGIRQVAKYVYDNRLVHKKVMDVDTLAGIKTITITTDENDLMTEARVNMGAPILEARNIPVTLNMPPSPWYHTPIPVLDRVFDFSMVSMGNPHAVTFLDDIADLAVHRYGRAVEMNQAIFPERTNVEFIQVIDRKHIKMRVWERGSGETLACGTGACASVVASVLNGRTDTQVEVELLGGTLQVNWDKSEDTVFMTGDALVAFTGIYTTDLI